MRQEVQQTFKDRATQMTGIGVYVSNQSDRLMPAEPYETAEEFHVKRLRGAMVVQRWARRWLAQRYVNRLRAEKRAREEWERQIELDKQKQKEDRKRREYERRMNPKTRADFDLLYHHLEHWRQEQLELINKDEKLTEAQRKAAICQLLDDETELLSGIERQKLEAGQHWKAQRIKALLDNVRSDLSFSHPARLLSCWIRRLYRLIVFVDFKIFLNTSKLFN